jgi:predicted RNase H-like HicB family nuclease
MVSRGLINKLAVQIPFPILISRENRWFVASCPPLQIATQGKTEKEVRENMTDLITEYLKDPDTPKPSMKDMLSVSLVSVSISVADEILHGKASTPFSSKGH